MPTDRAMEARARRAAKRAGFIARKSRARTWSCDNQQQFQLVDASSNVIWEGDRFELTPEDVIAFCAR